MLSEKYRPESFADVIGQSKTIRLLKWHLDRTETGLAILLSGPSGTGKTSIGECAARYWRVADHDIIRIESTELDVAAVRRLSEDMRYFGSGKSGRKCFVIDEIHTLSDRAGDRLLSLLEALPAHVLVVATTTESNWTSGTLLSRWTQLDLSKPRCVEVAKHLERIAAAEGLATPDNGWAVKYVKAAGLNLRNLINQLPAHLLRAASAVQAA